MARVKLPPLPSRMRGLERDPRGYPVPWGVWRDPDDRPHFQINDEAKRLLALFDDLCPICGQKLMPGRWFVGGPRSAFDPHGGYADPPMHGECMRFALQVCPYLAAPRYEKRIDTGTLAPAHAADRIFIDRTQIPERPAVFVAVLTRGQRLLPPNYYVVPQRPYLRVEYWRAGRRGGAPDAMPEVL